MQNKQGQSFPIEVTELHDVPCRRVFLCENSKVVVIKCGLNSKPRGRCYYVGSLKVPSECRRSPHKDQSDRFSPPAF